MEGAEQERLQLVYDNIVGLATAGVVSVLPSAEELLEGLSHLRLTLKTEQELSACLWVLEAALGSGCSSFPSFEAFLSMAGAAELETLSDATPPSSAISMVSSDGRKHGELRVQLEGLLSGGTSPTKSAKSFLSSEESGPALEVPKVAAQEEFEDSEVDLPPMPSVEQRFLSELLQEALRHLKPLRQEVRSKGRKILDFLEELLEQSCGKAEELENTLAAALQSAQQCREAVKKSWKQCKTVLSRFGKAEMERRKWQEKWQAQCAELEELKKEAKESLNIKDVSKAQVAALRERTSRLGIMLGGEGPVAIAFAWFRVAAFWAPLRRKHLANLEKFAAKSSLDRLRRRMKAAGTGHEDLP